MAKDAANGVPKARSGIPLKPAGSAVKLVKKATERLEEDAKEMEDRLARLRLSMLEEKKKRDAELPAKYSGSRWRSASEDRGSVSRYAQDVQSKAKVATTSGGVKGKKAAHTGDSDASKKKKKKVAVGKDTGTRSNGGLCILSAVTVSKWTTAQVLEWLCAIGLEQYQSGFEYHQVTGAALLEMTLDEYTQMGVTKLSARNILYTEIDKIRDTCAAATAAVSSTASTDKRSQPTEIIDPKLRNVGPEAYSPRASGEVHWSRLKPLSETAPTAASDEVPVNLADGEFDEDASHASFMKALLEWRTSDNDQAPDGTRADGDNESLWVNPMIRFDEDDDEGKQNAPIGGALLEGDYDEEKEQEAFRRAVEAWRSGTSSENSVAVVPRSVEQMEQGCTAAQRKSCWQCYQIVTADSLLTDDQTGKAFCSTTCRTVYQNEYSRFYRKQPDQ